MSNAIDRLEELEGRATGDAPHTVHAGYLPYTDYPHLVAAGPTNATAIARFADADEAKAYAALRNASKPLLAVVRAGERLRLIQKQRDKDEAEYASGGQTFGIEDLNRAERDLDTALATLKETTL